MAQLVARALWEREVAGSNPATPTMTCCTGPLITGGVLASALSLFTGLVSMDILLIAGGLAGIILIGGGYLYRAKISEKFNEIILKF